MPGSAEQHVCTSLRRLVGRRVVRIDRVLFEAEGAIEGDDGPIEIELAEGHVVLLDGATDGESIRVRETPWEDPFPEPLTAENRAFVAESGRWIRVLSSGEQNYSELVGAPITGVQVLENEFGRIAGAAIETEARTLWFVVQGDEARVRWASPLGFRVRERYSR
jgi:hypothetical protein